MTNIAITDTSGQTLIARAREAGLSDDSINAFLAPRWEMARAAGYSDDDIRSYLEVKLQPEQLTPATAPLSPISDQMMAEIRESADKELENIGQTLSIAGPIVGRLPYGTIAGAAIGTMGKILKIPETRAPITETFKDTVVKRVLDEINRAYNAYGQQQFINGGGMPHR